MNQTQIGVTITSGPQNWTIIQQKDGYGSVALHGKWHMEGPAVSSAQVYVRIMNEDDGREIVSRIPSIMENDHSWSIVIDHIPAGGLYRVETNLQIDGNPGLEWAVRGDMIHHIGVGDLWIIAGQSNAAGYGRGPVQDPSELGIHLLRNSGRWDLATHPFNESTSSIHMENREQANPGHSPFLAFAKLVKKEVGYPIGLVQTALGGSPLSAWNPAENGYLFQNMIRIAQSAGGSVAGILWYQGCSDCNPAEASTYLARFQHSVKRWREELGDPNLPVLTVQLNRYTAQSVSEESDNSWGLLREVQRQAASIIDHVYVIPANDCPLSDEIHNSPAGNILIGERMAKKALSEVYKIETLHNAPNIASATLGKSAADGQQTVTLYFDNVSGYLISIGPKDQVFTVIDEAGQVDIVSWSIVGRNEIQLILSRRTEGAALVHGVYEMNPAYFLPLDTSTYMPILSFYNVPIL